MDAKEIYRAVTGQPYTTSPHEWLSTKVLDEKDRRIAELEAALRPLADAYQVRHSPAIGDHPAFDYVQIKNIGQELYQRAAVALDGREVE